MKLLLDTHTFLWLVEGSTSLSTPAAAALSNPANELFLSVASIWELAIKTSSAKQKLSLSEPLETFVAKWTAAYQLKELPILGRHALQVRALPDRHRDPFDRILIAQALTEGMTLVSADTQFAAYPVTVIW